MKVVTLIIIYISLFILFLYISLLLPAMFTGKSAIDEVSSSIIFSLVVGTFLHKKLIKNINK